jgi:hypothetical protein
MQMQKIKKPRRKVIRTYLFDKRFVAAACVMAAVVYGGAHFRNDLPMLNLASAGSRPTEHIVPAGSILIPYGNGACRLHAIDNATGRIQDDGLVDCSAASDQNTVAWKPLVDAQKATEIRKSFRHE